jgi:hypothetical protein
MPAKTPAISRAVTDPCSFATALAAQDIRVLTCNGEWIAVEFRNAQFSFIEQFAIPKAT